MKVAIVHYWLTSMRGGEKMLESILELFPDADIFTHVYDPSRLSETIKSHNVITSSINKMPFVKRMYKMYMPFMPRALLEFDLSQYDLVFSSEAGPAKGVVPAPDAYHICYCHSPMRYLWDMYHEYFNGTNFFVRFFMKQFIPSLRVWDITSANLVDRFITNSNYVAHRIRRYYKREAKVVFGPANIEKYIHNERDPKDFYLFFGQLAENKRVDIAIDACILGGKKLIVSGGGNKEKFRHHYRKHKNIVFTGRISDDYAAELFSNARALLFPGIEDMGLIPIEANAGGCPVIAYRKGGVLDTIKENETGIFFDEQTPRALLDAMNEFEQHEDKFKDRSVFTRHVARFSKEAFKDRVMAIIKERIFI
ncbi:MAG: glycosyltransferase [Spirochaetaceae bacterium]|jgi:glycosyltransferase involved in cell wall biosynthesis|nr:glycosyltransferase [Spirochaetaceae bacterium]